MKTISHNDPVVVSLVRAVRSGNVDALRRLLDETPGLASKRATDNKGGSRTALHVVTDWPGYFPNGPMIVKMLIEVGADPNARTTGGQFSETPLHRAASSDDVDVAAALIDGGAEIEVLGGSIAGGTPLDRQCCGLWMFARGSIVGRTWRTC